MRTSNSNSPGRIPMSRSTRIIRPSQTTNAGAQKEEFRGPLRDQNEQPCPQELSQALGTGDDYNKLNTFSSDPDFWRFLSRINPFARAQRRPLVQALPLSCGSDAMHCAQSATDTKVSERDEAPWQSFTPVRFRNLPSHYVLATLPFAQMPKLAA
jgi:hypothetical protein